MAQIVQIRPTEPQFDYIHCDDPYPALVAGFGSGKTEAAVNRCILGKLRYPGLNRGFYLPTYDLIRMIAWPRFEQKLTELGLPYKLYKSPLNYIDVQGYGSIVFRSMDTPQRIIGYEHADADVDELDTLKKEDAAHVWRQILARNRQKKPDGKPNTIGTTTTPEGFRFVYETWGKQPAPGYRLIRASTFSNPNLPEGYIDSLRAVYPPHLLDAYLEGRFVNLTSGTIYHAFSRTENHTDAEHDGREALHIGMDFNVGKMAAVCHVIRSGQPLAVDEITDALDTPDIIRIIKERYWRYMDGEYRKVCEIHVYPDSSGDSRKSVNASITDIQQLRQAGFIVHAPRANPPVKNRINSMNAMFCNGDGERRYKVNVLKCPDYADCLEQQVWSDKGEPDKKAGKDHKPDAGGYFIHFRFPIIKPAANINLGIMH